MPSLTRERCISASASFLLPPGSPLGSQGHVSVHPSEPAATWTLGRAILLPHDSNNRGKELWKTVMVEEGKEERKKKKEKKEERIRKNKHLSKNECKKAEYEKNIKAIQWHTERLRRIFVLGRFLATFMCFPFTWNTCAKLCDLLVAKELFFLPGEYFKG